MNRESRLWAITAYFDPFNKGHRLQAYREFRRRLAIPLVAVELSFHDQFHLRQDDADVVIHLSGGAVLWQKERLLNVALQALPAHVDAVAWLDCDLVFLRHDWPQALLRRLEDFELVQPFRSLYYQDQKGALDLGSSAPEMRFDSVAFLFDQGTLPEEAYDVPGQSQRLRYAPGVAWAARRSTLDTHGFYDAGVLGGGDKLIFVAAAERYSLGRWMSPAHLRHFTEWAGRFSNAIKRKISCIEGDLVHLWHGDLAGRRYYERLVGFERFGFDPDADLSCQPDGPWFWKSEKPEMHAFVREQAWLTASHNERNGRAGATRRSTANGELQSLAGADIAQQNVAGADRQECLAPTAQSRAGRGDHRNGIDGPGVSILNAHRASRDPQR